MVINAADDFEPDIVSHYNDIMKKYQTFTDEFLEPFNQMRNYEFSEGGPGNFILLLVICLHLISEF